MNPEIIKVSEVFNVAVEKLWQAITSRKAMEQWYFHIPGFRLEEGCIYDFYEPGDKKEFLHRCRILEIQPQQIFKHTWAYPEFSDAETIVTWHLVPEGEQTRLTVVHEGLEALSHAGPAFAIENFREGWNEIVKGSLKRFVE